MSGVGFYVYTYIDPRDGTPFYIGKGHGRRDTLHLRTRQRHDSRYSRHLFYCKLNKLIDKEGIVPIVSRLNEGLSESEAFRLEQFYILALGRRKYDTNPGPLCNLTNGGEGSAGYVPSPSNGVVSLK